MPFQLVPNTPANFLQNAKTLAWVCQFSYLEVDSVRTEFRNIALRMVEPGFDHEGTQAFLASDAVNKVLVFRGTEGGKIGQKEAAIDIATDVRAVPVPEPEFGLVHKGFQEGLNRVWGPVLAALKADPAPSLWITGHSLGGALAALAAARVTGDSVVGPQLRGLFTFGQPRVGDISFRNECNRRLGNLTYRIVHKADIVAHVPPLLFTHFGQEKFLDFQNNIVDAIPEIAAIPRLTGLIGELVAAARMPFALSTVREKLAASAPAIEDHMIWNYRAVIDPQADAANA